MNFAWSEEQEAFRESVRRFVAARWPLAHVRRLAADVRGYEPAVWRQLAGELEGVGLAVPAAHGGSGASLLELAIAVEELGRELAGGPFFATAGLAVLALRSVATAEEQAAILPVLAAGERLATLAVSDAPGPADPGSIGCRAEGGRLTGEKRFVLDAPHAELLLVAAREAGTRGPAGVGLFAVEAGAPGLRVEPRPGLDLTRRLGHVRLEAVPAERLGGPGSAWPALERTLALAAILLAAEQVGGAERCLERSVEHVRERLQFGRAIGSFQAVKHRAVDVLTALELARSVSWWASWVASRALDAPAPARVEPELAEAAALASTLAGDAFEQAAYACIHLHGGMGFTWEHDAHLYYRRARADRVLLGDPAARRAGLARELGLLGLP